MQDSTGSGLPSAVSKEQCNWAMLAHLSGLLVFVTVVGGMLGPLVLWLLRKLQLQMPSTVARCTGRCACR